MNVNGGTYTTSGVEPAGDAGARRPEDLASERGIP